MKVTERDRYDLYVNGVVHYAYSSAYLYVVETEVARLLPVAADGTLYEIVLVQGGRPVRTVRRETAGPVR